MKKILCVVFVIVGALIGAGFASGQEIYQFFFSYGIKGLLGIIFSSVLMGIVIYKVLTVVKVYNIETYREFLEVIIVDYKKKSENKKIIEIISIIINTFVVVTFFIMVAGFGGYFEQEIGINKLFGSIILAFFCYIVLKHNIKGVVKVSELLVPILIIIIICIGFKVFRDINVMQIKNYVKVENQSNYILNSILYCSYNSLLLTPVLISLGNYIENRKQIKIISIIITNIIIILSVIIFFILIRVDVNIKELEMPVVYVVRNIGEIWKILYGFIILGSIFTTAISLGASFLQNVSKNGKCYPQLALIMCITSVLVSQIGFSNLIRNIYPVFGYIRINTNFIKCLEKNIKNCYNLNSKN